MEKLAHSLSAVFFTTVNAALNGSVVHANEFIYDGLVGLDEERALVNASKVAFPSYFGPRLLKGPCFI